jgi:hypothetical protein
MLTMMSSVSPRAFISAPRPRRAHCLPRGQRRAQQATNFAKIEARRITSAMTAAAAC